MHSLSGALPAAHVRVWVTRGCLVHWYIYAPPRYRTSLYCRTFITLSVSLWNDLADLFTMVWEWRVLRAGPMLY